jgi:hypothetical protein
MRSGLVRGAGAVLRVACRGRGLSVHFLSMEGYGIFVMGIRSHEFSFELGVVLIDLRLVQ